MKKYDRQKKKWVTIEEHEKTHKPRSKEFCRGKKPHDFVLVLPDYVSYNSSYKFNPEKYYKIKEEIRAFEIAKEKEFAKMGINISVRSISSLFKLSRLYLCSVCKKRKYD